MLHECTVTENTRLDVILIRFNFSLLFNFYQNDTYSNLFFLNNIRIVILLNVNEIFLYKSMKCTIHAIIFEVD